MSQNEESNSLIEIGKTDSGHTIYCKENGVGGHTYWSDSIGGGVVVWDTCLVSEEEMLFVIKYERLRRKNES